MSSRQRLTHYKIMFKFNWPYFIVALYSFLTELLIALFVRDMNVRSYGGDFLVVTLIYCTIKSFLVTDVNFMLKAWATL